MASLRLPAVKVSLDPLFCICEILKSEKYLLHSLLRQFGSIYLSSLPFFSVQEPSMQSVQISNSGQQVDACAGANGGVYFVL